MSGVGRGIRRVAQNGGNGDQSTPAPGGPPPGLSKGGDVSKLGDVTKLTADVDKMAMAELTRRPGVGRTGRPIQLETNHFEIRISDKSLVVQQYHVIITNPFRDKIDRDEKREAFYRVIDMNLGTAGGKHFNNKYEIIYDGEAICYSLSKFNFKSNPMVLYLPVKNLSGRTMELRGEGDDEHLMMAVNFTHVGAVHVDLSQAFTSAYVPAEEKLQGPLQVMDAIFRAFRSLPGNDNYYPYGRSIYKVPGVSNPGFSLGKGIELWTGLFSATKICQGNTPNSWKPLLNLDLANTAFIKKTVVLEMMCEVLESLGGGGRGGPPRGPPSQQRGPNVPQRELNPMQLDAFKRSVKGLQVETVHLANGKRIYKVVDLLESANSQLAMFTYRDRATNVETRMTVADYFAKVRQQPLKYPHLPCLIVGKKDKQSFLPVEVVMVREKQKYTKKLDDKQTADMIKRTALPAAERKQKTLEMVNEAFGPQAQDQYLKNYETAINLQMVKLTGRVIEPPCLQYKNNQPTTPAGGEWKCDRSVFTEGGRIKTCAVLCMHRGDTNVVAAFYNALLKRCHEMGMAVNPALANNPTYFGQGVRLNMLEQCFEEAVKSASGELDLIIVIMDGRSADAYAAVKRLGDIEKGIMTQVVLSKNLQGRDGGPSQMTCTNLALKINLKRAGQNYQLLPPRGDASTGDITRKFMTMSTAVNGNLQPTLYLGIDVTHPAKGEQNARSISAVVGNIDGPGTGPTKYGASVKVQGRRVEHVIYMHDQIKERLMAFYRNTKLKPARLFVLRDGVSESQFSDVLREEVTAIRKVCTSLDENYKPAITFIVVQKRHHTRLYCQNPRDAVGRAGNVPPGTVVDSTIVHPYEFDFYLCSHTGIQGTSKPAHYYVLHDDSKYTADELQHICYQLCHLYGRCPRSVSLPAPVYYADLVAMRAKYHLQDLIGSHSSQSTNRAATVATSYPKDGGSKGDSKGDDSGLGPTGTSSKKTATSGTGSSEDLVLQKAVCINAATNNMYFI